jgi:hypothetical protein
MQGLPEKKSGLLCARASWMKARLRRANEDGDVFFLEDAENGDRRLRRRLGRKQEHVCCRIRLVFCHICSLWMGKLQQSFWLALGTKQRVVPLSHMHCCENGFRPNWAGDPRFTFANSTWPGIFKKSFSSRIKNWDEANEWCEASLRNLKEILQEAETESAEHAMERLTQSVKNGGVDGIGKIT